MREATSCAGRVMLWDLAAAKSLVRYSVGSFDTAVSEVGSDALVARSSKLCWGLVVSE